MLKEFVRTYAKNMGFGAESADFIAEAGEDQDLFTLSLNDAALCTLAPLEADGKPLVSAVIAIGAESDEEKLKGKVQDLMSKIAVRRHLKCKLIAALTEDDVLGYFAVLPLDNLEQADFDDFMSSLMYFAGKTDGEVFEPAYHEFIEDTETIDRFLESAGLDPEFLAQSFDSIAFPDGPVVSIIKCPECGSVVLQSLLGRLKSTAQLKEFLTANMCMFGRHFFTFSGEDEVFLNTQVRLKDGCEAFYECISRHVQLQQDFAGALEKGAAAPAEDELLHSFSQFLMA